MIRLLVSLGVLACYAAPLVFKDFGTDGTAPASKAVSAYALIAVTGLALENLFRSTGAFGAFGRFLRSLFAMTYLAGLGGAIALMLFWPAALPGIGFPLAFMASMAMIGIASTNVALGIREVMAARAPAKAPDSNG